MMRHTFAELGTSVAQEKELRAAADKVRESAREARGTARAAREQLSSLLRSPEYDAARAEETRKLITNAAEFLSAAVGDALKTTYETLTPEQRQKLAEKLERGPFGRFGYAR